jgi:mRNA interferase YafQ
MYAIRPTTKFQKDLKRLEKRGYNISLLTDVIKKLADGDILP